MGKKQWIHHAMKNWDSTDAHDSEEKARISKIIHDNNLHHFPLYDETIFINKTDFSWTKIHPEGFTSKEDLMRQWAVFKPDMLFPLRNLIIEIDGSFHTDSEKGAKRTKLRNSYYEYAGIKLLIYTPLELKEMSDEILYQDLKSKFLV